MKPINSRNFLYCLSSPFAQFSSREANHYARYLLIWLFAFLLNGCAGSSVNIAKQQPRFLAEPTIMIAPVSDTPMVRILTLKTDVPVRVSVDVATQGKNWTLQFEEYNTEHRLPLYGFHPNKKHTLTVYVHNLADHQLSYHRDLIVSMPALPNWFPSIEVKSTPNKMEPGYTLFNVVPEGENKQFGALLVIVDEKGTVVWYHKGEKFSDVRKLKNGNLLTISGNKIVELDMRGIRIREWQAVGKSNQAVEGMSVKTASFHHEVYPMESGNFLTLSIELRDYDNYWSSDSDPDAPKETAAVAGDVIVEFDQEGKVVNQWSLLDLLDPYRIAYSSLLPYWDPFFNKKTRDWSHANAVIHDPIDDTIIVSVRHQDATIKFSRKTGKLIWILGPQDNWDKTKFAKLLLKPVDETENFFPFHQHAPMILPNGNLFIYDNGSFRASPFAEKMPTENSFSRAVEYSIDETTMEVELVWQYGQFVEQQYYAGALGDVDLLPETGNVLITHGNLPGAEEKFSARVIEVTHSKPAMEVFHMHVFDNSTAKNKGWRIYRAERLADLYP